MDYNSKYTGEQVEELLDKINASPEDVATPSGNYPDMTVGKASQADTAARAINADNATNATNATTAEQATKATTADYATTAGQATTAESAKTATNADRATTAEHATTAESTTHADTATKANFATDLTGRNEATAEEFTFRPSAGNKSIRDDSATIKRIKGNSIAWNQQLKTLFSPNITADTVTSNGITFTRLSSGGYNISGSNNTSDSAMSNNTVANLELKAGHKYVIIPIGLKKSTISFYGPESGVSGFVIAGARIITPTNSASVYLRSIVQAGVIDVNETIYCNVHDLTQMFGAGNEPDTVEEFKALFPDNHYEYNPGQLVSMTANGLFTNGFNQWDEEWESGVYKYWSDGLKSDSSEYIRSTNFIKVIPTNTYCLNIAQGVDAGVGFYDENNNFLGQASYSYSNNSRLFQVPANCRKITFYTKATTYNNDICINLSHTGVENGKYEPYWNATKDLSVIQKYFPNGMRSAGSIYDEISFDETTQKWVAIQRVGNVDLGSLSWSKNPDYGFYISLGALSGMQNVTDNNINANILCTKYTTGRAGDIFTQVKTNSIAVSTTHLVVGDLTYNTANDFKTAMSGVLLNYELAEPIITVIEEPVNLSYKVGDFGIEQTLSDLFSAPFRADIIYQFNATDRIRENSLNIEKLSKTQNEYLPLAGGTMSGQINSQDIKPVEDSTYQLGDSTHKYDNVFSNFFTGNLEGNAKTATVATDLTGRIEATPEVFTYRPSAGEKSIKDDNAFIRRVKGNSVVWNQILVPRNSTETSNGITVTHDGTGKVVVKGTATATAGVAVGTAQIITGHKYVYFGLIGGGANKFYWSDQTASVDTGKGCIAQPTYATGNRYFALNVLQGITVDFTFYPQVCDLTAMFGVGNEPNTVEEFRALYPDSYYPYNPGELRNLVCSGIKTVGFNQWDEQWEVGSLGTDEYGSPIAFDGMIRSTNYNPIFPSAEYYIRTSNAATYIWYYDSDKKYIGRNIKANSRFFITPTNAAYFKLRIGDTTNTITTYNHDICINLHHTGWRDGEYEPYKEVTHALPLSKITNGEPLRKAGSVYDEINETHYIKRVGVVDLGSLNWKLWAHNIFSCEIQNFAFATTDSARLNGLFCSKYTIDTKPDIGPAMTDKTMKRQQGFLRIRDTSFTDAASFKASLSGILLHYELAEPIVTPIETPIDFNYYVEDFGTEEALLAEDSAPFRADIVYQFNATDQIRNNSRNIDKLQKSAFTPSGTSAQYIRGDGSYGDRFELSQSTPINDGEYEMPDAIHQFILTPNYYAKSPVNLDNSTTVTVCVTPPEDSNYLAEYWFEFAVDDTLPNIEYYQPNNSDAVFRIDGDMMTGAVNILHLISSDGGNTFFGEIRSYSL